MVKESKNPIENVTFEEAKIFCEKVSILTNRTIRLPTELEWEYCCRAFSETSFYTGPDERELEIAAWFTKNSQDHCHNIGLKAPNEFGTFDMHGNVAEWCLRDAHDTRSPRLNAIRGGAWNMSAPYLRAGKSILVPTNIAMPYIGFRVLMENSVKN